MQLLVLRVHFQVWLFWYVSELTSGCSNRADDFKSPQKVRERVLARFQFWLCLLLLFLMLLRRFANTSRYTSTRRKHNTKKEKSPNPPPCLLDTVLCTRGTADFLDAATSLTIAIKKKYLTKSGREQTKTFSSESLIILVFRFIPLFFYSILR